jgi:hypothetical protein
MFPLLVVHLQIIFRRVAQAWHSCRGVQLEIKSFRRMRDRVQARRIDRKLTGRTAAIRIHRSSVGIHLAFDSFMLKLLGSYALAKLLGFGLVGAIVIYALLSLLT